MKPLLTVVLVALTAVPAVAQNVDVNSIFPPLTFPEVPTETVTQDTAGISK